MYCPQRKRRSQRVQRRVLSGIEDSRRMHNHEAEICFIISLALAHTTHEAFLKECVIEALFSPLFNPLTPANSPFRPTRSCSSSKMPCLFGCVFMVKFVASFIHRLGSLFSQPALFVYIFYFCLIFLVPPHATRGLNSVRMMLGFRLFYCRL